MNSFISLIALLLCSISTFAQYKIRGKVVDANTAEAISFATIKLMDAKGQEMLKGVQTDIDGRFAIDQVDEATYQLEASFMGYADFKTKVTPEMLKREGGMRVTIKLREDVELMTEVEVVGSRSQLQMDIDKKTFVVTEGANTVGVSASDILRDIPTVDVDIDGNVSLRGNENVEVFINGKCVGLSSESQGDLLDQFPAGSIEKVEVITNPSSKYSAEGSAGIINIVLKSDAKPGVFGSVSAGLSYPWDGKLGANLGSSLTVTKGKWTFIASLGWQRNTMHGYSDVKRKNFRKLDTTYVNTIGDRDFIMNSFFARLSADCKLNDNNHIGVSGLLSKGNSLRDEYTKYHNGYMIGANSIPTSSSVREANGEMPRSMYNLKLDYGHTFKDKSELAFAAQYSANMMDQDMEYDQYYFDEYDSELAEQYTNQIQSSDRTRTNTNITLDWEKNVGSKSKVEAGVSTQISVESNDVEYRIRRAGETDYTIQPGLTSDFEHQQNIYAFYGMWSQQLGRFSYKLGLRGEYTDVTWRQYSTGTKDQFDPYGNFFPSLFLSYKSDEWNEFQFSGQRRIMRPRGFRINPNPNMSDSSNITLGNPSLEPEKATSLEFNYLHTTAAGHLYTATIYYKYTDDVVQDYSWIDGNALKRTFANMNKSHSAGLELIAKNKFKHVTFTTNVDLYYYRLVGGKHTIPVMMDNGVIEDLTLELSKRNSFSYMLKEGIDFRLPAKITGQFAANYRSRRVSAQGDVKGQFTMNFGLKRTFLDNRLSVAANIRDITNSRNRNTTTTTRTFYQHSKNQRNSRTINLNVAYNFGTKQAKKGKRGESGSIDMDMDDGYDDF